MDTRNEEFVDQVKTGNLKRVEDLYARGDIDVNYRRKKDGKTALHMAYAFQNMSIIKFLLKNGANINMIDSYGDSPLSYLMRVNTPDPRIMDIVLFTLNLTSPFSITQDNIIDALIKAKNKLVKKELEKHINSKYKIVGHGSFGVVASPSFKTGNKSKVTKFVFLKNTYNKTLKNAKNIKTKLPSLNILTEPYPNKYSYKNVRNDNSGLGAYLKHFKPSIKNTNEVYPILMENLGVSLDKLDSSYIPLIQEIPIETILQSYSHLADVLIELQKNKYIHGDIRETNVVLNPSTGKFTIIDFDWLYPIDEFIEKYTFQFYSHPPELIFAKQYFDHFQNLFEGRFTVRDLNAFIYNRIAETNPIYAADRIHTPTERTIGVRETIHYITSISETNSDDREIGNVGEKFKNVMEKAYMEIDSYGLGYSLCIFQKLLEKTATKEPSIRNSGIDFIRELVYGLCNQSYTYRMNIYAFKEGIQYGLKQLGITVPLSNEKNENAFFTYLLAKASRLTKRTDLSKEEYFTLLYEDYIYIFDYLITTTHLIVPEKKTMIASIVNKLRSFSKYPEFHDNPTIASLCEKIQKDGGYDVSSEIGCGSSMASPSTQISNASSVSMILNNTNVSNASSVPMILNNTNRSNKIAVSSRTTRKRMRKGSPTTTQNIRHPTKRGGFKRKQTRRRHSLKH